METIEHIIDQADRRCKASGARLTDKRKQVLSLLIESNKALSAYELTDAYKRTYQIDITPMSIYRILSFLESEHLAHKLEIANKYVACEHISCDGEHSASQFLICSNCHKVKEISISNSALSELKGNIQSAGFQLVNPQLEVHCICDECLAKGT